MPPPLVIRCPLHQLGSFPIWKLLAAPWVLFSCCQCFWRKEVVLRVVTSSNSLAFNSYLRRRGLKKQPSRCSFEHQTKARERLGFLWKLSVPAFSRFCLWPFEGNVGSWELELVNRAMIQVTLAIKMGKNGYFNCLDSLLHLNLNNCKLWNACSGNSYCFLDQLEIHNIALKWRQSCI